MIKNKYKVSARLWNKFSEKAKTVFNRVYVDMGDQSLCSYPNSQIPVEHWKTIQHNAACYAAWATDRK